MPGGENLVPPFATSNQFLAGAINPSPQNGLNSTDDSVEIIFSLMGGKDIDEVLSNLRDGSLRVGLHVQAIGTDGKSDSYVNQVPEPGILILLGLSMTAIGVASRFVGKMI